VEERVLRSTFKLNTLYHVYYHKPTGQTCITSWHITTY